MADIKPFHCIRPREDAASQIAALPYDVYSREEAKKEVKKEPLSFLKIDRAETELEDSIDTYDDRVYIKARETLNAMIEEGLFVTEEMDCYYVYELIMDGRSQTGLTACCSIDDYQTNVIKKHENTREDKELDRIRHVDTCNAQTGPIFLAYRSHDIIQQITNETKQKEALYDFTSSDGITHRVWRLDDNNHIAAIRKAFDEIQDIYIADGHHRAASAVKVGLKRREEAGSYTKDAEFNYFLSVLFPEDQLMILPYNRVVKDLYNNTPEEFLEKVSDDFNLQLMGAAKVNPVKKGSFGMYLKGSWYKLEAKEHIKNSLDPVESLDVSILQKHLLSKILGINDPRTDKRIDFIGGIRGLKELEDRVHTDMAVAFSMYPTSISELFSVSDAGLLMPPKSTWFEPKLRSGLFIHKL